VEHIKDLDELQAKQVIGDRDTQVLVVATGMPDPEDPNQSQILVILEEISRRPEPMLQDAKKRFRLTDKELLVIQHLLKGWTNKEIANQVGVTEQTIKEHIKNIMKKTKTVTRTGILLAVSGIDLSEQTSR
jgi:DNA-binding CsgD family transcriptional regulator